MGGFKVVCLDLATALVKDQSRCQSYWPKNIKKEVSFNVLALGAVQTEMLEEAFPGYQAPIKANEMDYIFDFTLTGNITEKYCRYRLRNLSINVITHGLCEESIVKAKSFEGQSVNFYEYIVAERKDIL
jgi:hypothetical protein